MRPSPPYRARRLEHRFLDRVTDEKKGGWDVPTSLCFVFGVARPLHHPIFVGWSPLHRCATGRSETLPLRELEAAAGLGSAVLLALDDARVAGEETLALDRD